MSTIGPKIILEGEKEYRKAISDVNSSMRVLRSEMRAVSAEFDGNANSIDALTKRNDVLTKQQAEQEKRVKLLRGALENATKEFGENSRVANKWQTQLNNAQAQLSKLNRELGENEKHLSEAKSSTDKTAKSIDEFGKEIKGAADETKIFGDVLKANLLSDAIFDGIKKLGSLMIDMIKDSKDLASDLLEVQNVVDVTFGESASDIDKWSETIGEAFGLSELKGKEFVGFMGAMLKSMEVADDQVLSMSKNIVELASDLASFYNIDVDTAFSKIQSGLSGQVMPLRELGINLNIANLEAYALAEGIKTSYSEMSQAEQVTLRYNYLLKATADAQGDFARNIDSQANQERIMQLQREEMLKQFGEAVLPAVTRATVKLNEAMKEMDGDLTKVAGVIADDIVDAFVWIIDNSDTIIAGLKGITAAVVTKKTADGVGHLISAYKTLTTTTQAATTAQIAFNTASKANIYVAIASAVIGVTTALASYVKNTKEATDETEKLSEKTQELINSSSAVREEIKKRTEGWEEETKSIEVQYGAISNLSDKLYSLAEKEQKTNAEKEQMVSLVKQLNEAIPNLNLQIDEQTGLLNKQKSELNGLIEKQKEYYLIQAAEKNYSAIAEQRASAEIELNRLYDERNMKETQLLRLRHQLLSLGGVEGQETAGFEKSKYAIDTTNESIKDLKDEIQSLNGEIQNQEDVLTESDKQWKANEEYIRKYTSSLQGVSGAMDEFSKKYQKALDEQTNIEIGTLENRQKQITKIYAETSKELDKQLKAEERAFAKSQQKRVEEVQRAQEEELAEVEKVHRSKLELLNEEYLAKIKAVDEDRYNEIKKLQDEINAIDNQQEAEDRALQAREDAEKKAELQARVESAKTIEERMDAQKELQRHEARVAKERLKEERSLQKDVLKEQISTINESYDEKIKSIEAEQKAEQEKLSDQLKAEKEAIAERYKLKLENLKDEQELERDALRDRQTEYKDYLREQKELAIANSKEIYEEDLAKFKMNQALKYEEVVSSEEQMKKAIQEYAYKNMQPGTARDTILRTSDLSEMLKYYNPTSAIKSSVPQTTNIDYSMIETAMANALKKLNLSVKINNREIGYVIDKRINKNLRR